MKQRHLVYCIGLLGVSLLSACTSPEPMISGPTSVRPAYPVANIEGNGSIFHVSSAQLFEEPTRLNVGDTIKIDISETLTGSNKSTTTTSKDTSLKQVGPGTGPNSALSGLLSSIFNLNATATGSDSFKGSGQTDNANTMTGTLMATVIEVLPNGNLTVAGEKRLSLNNSVNVLRFSGVVRPRDIRGGSIASSNVADARLEQLGGGAVADSAGQSTSQQFFRGLFSFW